MTFAPAASPDGRRALLALGALLLVEALVAWIALSRPPSALTFFLLLVGLALLGLILYLAWRAWLCLSLAYWVDRNAITIVWGPMRHTIPVGQVERILHREAVTALMNRSETRSEVSPGLVQRFWVWLHQHPRLRSWLIYGEELGRRHQLVGLSVTSLASQPLTSQLILLTADGAYGLSPADRDGFLASLEDHHQLGPTRILRQARVQPQIVESPLWRDRLALGLLAAGAVGVLLVMGSALWRFPSVVAESELSGQPVPAAIIALPIFALAVWLVNGLWGMLVYRQQRVAAGLLWSGTLAVEVVTFVAVLALTAA